MRALRWAALAALCLVIPSGSMAAQASLGVSGVYASLGGSDFDGIDSGIGGEASVWFRAGTSLVIGGGAHYTSHGLSGASENLSALGIFAEPRYRFATGGNIKPYVAGRVGWVRTSVSSGGVDVNASGFYFGGGGGLMVPVGAKVDLDFEVLFNTVSQGDVEVDGTSQPGTDASGTALLAKVGIVFRLGQ